jgi:hypothetical protein
MKKNFISSIALLAFSFCLYGQDGAQFKRTPYKLKVAVDKKSFYEEDLKETAFVLPDKTVQLYPGETIYIEVEQENGVIKNMTAVKEIKNPAITLTISFTQTAAKKVHEMMMLKIDNPFSSPLIYKASIFLFNQKKWVSTNVYPVMEGLSAYETWPDIITSIGLNSWAFQNK